MNFSIRVSVCSSRAAGSLSRSLAPLSQAGVISGTQPCGPLSCPLRGWTLSGQPWCAVTIIPGRTWFHTHFIVRALGSRSGPVPRGHENAPPCGCLRPGRPPLSPFLSEHPGPVPTRPPEGALPRACSPAGTAVLASGPLPRPPSVPPTLPATWRPPAPARPAGPLGSVLRDQSQPCPSLPRSLKPRGRAGASRGGGSCDSRWPLGSASGALPGSR